VNPRWLALAAVVLLVLGAWQGGLIEWISEPERARDFLRESGPLGPLLYVLAFALIEPLGVPGLVFVGPATQIWPYWLVVILSILGATGAGLVAYVAARWFARDWVQARLPDRVRRATDGAETRPLRTVILVRLLFFLAAPAHWALGVSNIRFAPFLLGSLVGFTPPMILFVYAIDRAIDLMEGQRPWAWLAVAVLGVVGFLAFQWWRRQRQGSLPPKHPAKSEPGQAALEARRGDQHTP
jgi:uncharacterized membrane protein YdjX (TVP38/TMEM64 family)